MDIRNRIRKADMKLDKTKDAKRLALEQINSPLAKYDLENNLRCIICQTVIKSAVVWKAHVNSKQHKLKIEATKQLKVDIQLKSSSNAQVTTSTPSSIVQHKDNISIPNKTVVIGKPATDKVISLRSVQQDFIPAIDNQRVTSSLQLPTAPPPSIEDILPEKFFDDPMKDAKVRNVEYKDDQTEEWERFQKEIKEDIAKSNTIIAGDQEVATVDRQIDEIDEQLQSWSRVIAMDKKIRIAMERQATIEKNKQDDNDSDTDDSDDENIGMTINDLSDWRAKRY